MSETSRLNLLEGQARTFCPERSRRCRPTALLDPGCCRYPGRRKRKLDRLARSLPDARDIVEELTTVEVKLNIGGSVQDPNDPIGRLLFNVLAMIAEFSVIWTRRDARLPDVRVAA